YHSLLRDHGLTFSGTSPDGRLVEIVELTDHPFFMASQFHPEFRSRPNHAHPMFREFVAAAVRRAVDRGTFNLPSGEPAEVVETANLAGDLHSSS
ncbi:MAG: hypothetical protein KY393_08950, partial [Actinobacteria bacterium]|nr:hypothetical protein [Actinomycetota bacterium]